MTEDQIKTRLEELKSQAKVMEGNLYAIQGAMQDCQFWLTQLESKDAPEEVNKPEGV
jgi:uncharacterized protein YukE